MPIWWAPIHFYDDLLSDPQIQHAEVFREVTVRGRTVHLVNHPNRYDGAVPELRVLALEIGEHTHEIMGELGYDAAEIDRHVAAPRRRGVPATAGSRRSGLRQPIATPSTPGRSGHTSKDAA